MSNVDEAVRAGGHLAGLAGGGVGGQQLQQEHLLHPAVVAGLAGEADRAVALARHAAVRNRVRLPCTQSGVRLHTLPTSFLMLSIILFQRS